MNYLRKLIHILLVSVLFCFSVFSQVPYSETNFIAPLNIPLVLAGTFGELRSNHFHSGIDIKTKGKEGFPVIAIENGYVSRVKVTPGGYGRALYVTHYNGYVSVY
ncbi:MAG: M23 family peptidase, partial [Flavobacteriales bacterium]|nr:M23 family peptidase [Flavobacteriales bacterium]